MRLLTNEPDSDRMARIDDFAKAALTGLVAATGAVRVKVACKLAYEIALEMERVREIALKEEV